MIFYGKALAIYMKSKGLSHINLMRILKKKSDILFSLTFTGIERCGGTTVQRISSDKADYFSKRDVRFILLK